MKGRTDPPHWALVLLGAAVVAGVIWGLIAAANIWATP